MGEWDWMNADWLQSVTGGLDTSGIDQAIGLLDPLQGMSYGPVNDISDLLAGQGAGGYVVDTTTGQVMSMADAYKLDPQAFLASFEGGLNQQAGLKPNQMADLEARYNQVFGGPVSTGLGSQAGGGAGGPGTGTQPAASFSDRLMTQLEKDPMKTLGFLASSGTGALGLGMMISGIVRANDGSSQIKLQNGRTVALSPQEAQLMDMVVSQARNQADVSGILQPAVTGAARTAAPGVQSMLSDSAMAAAAQARGQRGVAEAGADVLPGAARDIYGRDLANEQALQGVQGTAIRNLSDLLGGTAAGPAAYAGDEAARTAALDIVNKALAGNQAASPALMRQKTEALMALDARAKQELGQGYAYSTPYLEAKAKLTQQYDEAIQSDIRSQMSAANAIALPRSQFAESVQGNRFAQAAGVAGSTGRGSGTVGSIFGTTQAGAPTSAGSSAFLLGERPGALSLQGIGQLAPIGSQQANLQFQTDVANRNFDFTSAQNQQRGGGQLLGYSLAPYFRSIV